MTTKAKKRKKVEAWAMLRPSGSLEAFYPTREETERRGHPEGRVVHLTESDAAELKALRRVARAAKAYLESFWLEFRPDGRKYPEDAALFDALAALKGKR